MSQENRQRFLFATRMQSIFLTAVLPSPRAWMEVRGAQTEPSLLPRPDPPAPATGDASLFPRDLQAGPSVEEAEVPEFSVPGELCPLCMAALELSRAS